MGLADFYTRHFGILSSGVLIDTSGVRTISPWHSKRANFQSHIAEPVITVTSSGNFDMLDQFDSKLDNPRLLLYTCAIAASGTGPANTADLASGYAHYNREVPIFYPESDVTSTIRATQQTPGERESLAVHLSGNAFYDVYAGHVVLVSTPENPGGVPVHYGTMFSISGVKTQAPYPHFTGDTPDVVVSTTDIGEVVSGHPLQRFTFTFQNEQHLFDRFTEYGTGWYGAAASGFVRMSVSGVNAEGWFHPSYAAGQEPDTTNVFQYLMPTSGAINWTVPKYSDVAAKAYDTYDFYIRYVNSSGTLSPEMKLTYSAADIKTLHESAITSADDTKISDPANWHGPVPVVVKPLTHRKRLAIGVQDIDLQSIQYKEKGSQVSKPYATEEPIYALTLDATEQFPRGGDSQPWEFIKYYIQFGSVETDDWIRVSTRSRSGEVDDEGNAVPHTIILDTHMTGDEQQSLTEFDNIKFIAIAKPVYTFRVKTEVDTTTSTSRGLWSPFVYDYNVKVLNRSILSSANVERYLFT